MVKLSSLPSSPTSGDRRKMFGVSWKKGSKKASRETTKAADGGATTGEGGGAKEEKSTVVSDAVSIASQSVAASSAAASSVVSQSTETSTSAASGGGPSIATPPPPPMEDPPPPSSPKSDSSRKSERSKRSSIKDGSKSVGSKSSKRRSSTAAGPSSSSSNPNNTKSQPSKARLSMSSDRSNKSDKRNKALSKASPVQKEQAAEHLARIEVALSKHQTLNEAPGDGCSMTIATESCSISTKHTSRSRSMGLTRSVGRSRSSGVSTSSAAQVKKGSTAGRSASSSSRKKPSLRLGRKFISAVDPVPGSPLARTLDAMEPFADAVGDAAMAAAEKAAEGGKMLGKALEDSVAMLEKECSPIAKRLTKDGVRCGPVGGGSRGGSFKDEEDGEEDDPDDLNELVGKKNSLAEDDGDVDNKSASSKGDASTGSRRSQRSQKSVSSPKNNDKGSIFKDKDEPSFVAITTSSNGDDDSRAVQEYQPTSPWLACNPLAALFGNDGGGGGVHGCGNDNSTAQEKSKVEEFERAKEKALEEARKEAAEEVKRAKEKAGMKITAIAEELKWMEANLDYESKQNSALNAEIARLKSDVIAACAERIEADQARESAQEEANRYRDEAEARLTSQAAKLKELEAKWKSEAERNEELGARVAELKREASDDRKVSRRTIEDQGAELERVEKSLRAITARAEELRRVESEQHKAMARNEALERQVAELIEDIREAEEGRRMLDEANARLAKEKKRAAEEADARIIAHEEELEEVEARLEEEAERRVALEEQIAKLNRRIAKAKAKQEQLDVKAAKAKEQAVSNIEIKSRELKTLEGRLQSERGAKSSLMAQIAKLNKEIAAAKAKQEELDALAIKTKESAEMKIAAKVEELNEMKSMMTSATGQNSALNIEIEKLKAEIEEAWAEQVALDDANILLAEEAQEAREEADARIKAQMEELQRMEGMMEAASGRNDALKKEIAELRKSMSEDRKASQKTIDVQNEELKKMHVIIEGLKAEVDRERILRDKALQEKSGKEVELQSKIEALTKEITEAQLLHDARIKVVRTISMASNACDQSLIKVKDEDDGFDMDEVAILPKEDAFEQGILSVSESIRDTTSVGSTVSSVKGGASIVSLKSNGLRKGGWFKKLLSAASAQDDDASLSTIGSKQLSEGGTPINRKVGWLKSKKWVPGRSSPSQLDTAEESAGSEQEEEDKGTDDEISVTSSYTRDSAGTYEFVELEMTSKRNDQDRKDKSRETRSSEHSSSKHSNRKHSSSKPKWSRSKSSGTVESVQEVVDEEDFEDEERDEFEESCEYDNDEEEEEEDDGLIEKTNSSGSDHTSDSETSSVMSSDSNSDGANKSKGVVGWFSAALNPMRNQSQLGNNGSMVVQ